jgi:hypothetical protein
MRQAAGEENQVARPGNKTKDVQGSLAAILVQQRFDTKGGFDG